MGAACAHSTQHSMTMPVPIPGNRGGDIQGLPPPRDAHSQTQTKATLRASSCLVRCGQTCRNGLGGASSPSPWEVPRASLGQMLPSDTVPGPWEKQAAPAHRGSQTPHTSPPSPHLPAPSITLVCSLAYTHSPKHTHPAARRHAGTHHLSIHRRAHTCTLRLGLLPHTGSMRLAHTRKRGHAKLRIPQTDRRVVDLTTRRKRTCRLRSGSPTRAQTLSPGFWHTRTHR